MSKITRFADIPKFTRSGHYQINVSWSYVEEWIEQQGLSINGIDLDPDFQRAHVWTREQQIAYVEFILRGGESGKVIYWNCAGWLGDWNGKLELVDGKQRLEAVRAFMRDDLPAFGSLKSEFTDKFRWHDCGFLFNVNNLATRAEVLQWYLDLNAGGVIHTPEELEKVRLLLEKELTCDNCGAISSEVEYQEDPYEFDVNNTTVMRNLCPACVQQLCDDI